MELSRQRSGVVAGAVGLILLLGAVIALRNPGPLHIPAFLYEDGPVFYVQARELGWRAFVTPYAGYHHLIPRLIAAAAQAVPFHQAALVFAWGSLLATWSVAVWVLFLRLPLPVRCCMALTVALAPTYPGQYNHLTNLQWFLAVLWLAWWMQDVPESRLHRLSILVVGTLLALTGPFGLLVLPLFVIRYGRARHTFWRTCLVVWAVPLTIQLVTLLTHPVARAPVVEPAIDEYFRVAMRLWFDPLTGSAAVTVLVVTVSFVVLWRKRARRDLWLLPVGGLIWAAAGYWRSRHDLPSVGLYQSSTRYLIIPSIALIWSVLAAGSSIPGRARPWAVGAGVAFACWVCGLAAWKHPFNPGYVPDPPLATYTTDVAAGKPVTVQLPFGWTMRLQPGEPQNSRAETGSESAMEPSQ